MITREVDYTVEARNIARFGANMGSVDGVVVPRVHWGLSTRKVLTMDFIDGAPMGDAGPSASGSTRPSSSRSSGART